MSVYQFMHRLQENVLQLKVIPEQWQDAPFLIAFWQGIMPTWDFVSKHSDD